MNLRDLFSVGTKFEESISKKKNQINFTVATQNMDFVNRIDQNVAKYRIGIPMKKWWRTPFGLIVYDVLQGEWVLYRINNDEGDESLPF